MNIIEKHRQLLKAFDGSTVEAGWFASARYQAGKNVPDKMVGVPVARIARINEFGAAIKRGTHTIVIPARPFMRKAIVDFKAQNTAMTVKLTKAVLRDKLKPAQMLGQIGLFMENCIVESIKNGGWVKNAPSTVAKKGFDKPLIDTAQMWQAVTSKVVKS